MYESEIVELLCFFCCFGEILVVDLFIRALMEFLNFLLIWFLSLPDAEVFLATASLLCRLLSQLTVAYRDSFEIWLDE